jgi:hypothetical protein
MKEEVMKKLSLLLVVLVVGSAGLYGQMAIGTNFSIKGDATATAGYDIDNEVFGFKNESSANIKIELVAKSSANNSEMVDMEGGWYGSIELNDFQIIIDSDEEDSTEFVDSAMIDPMSPADSEITKSRTGLYIAEPDIVATLKNGPLFLKIFAAPDNKADLIAHIEDDEDGDHDAIGDDDGNDVGREINKGHGVTMGYDGGDLKLAIGVSSEESYDADNQGSYAVSAGLGVNVGPAMLDVAFVQGLENEKDADNSNADDTGIGVKLKTTIGAIELAAGADIELTGETDDASTSPKNEAMDFEVGANAKIDLTPNTSLSSDFIFSSVTEVATDVQVKIADKAGLVESLDLSIMWGMFDVSGGDSTDGADPMVNDEADMFLEGALDYGLEGMGGTLTPGTTVTVNQVDNGDATVGLEVRAVLTDAVPATTFGLKWKTGKLFKVGEDEAEQGAVSLWAKIEY